MANISKPHYLDTGTGSNENHQRQVQEYAAKKAMYANTKPSDLKILQADLEDLAKQYSVTHTSYSGTDLICSIQLPNKPPLVFGSLYQISYSTFREKTPVRSLGRVTPKGFTRGMRTVTGVMAFSMFDESIVRKALHEIANEGYHVLMDEMPLFDITISAANEYGSRSKLAILGVTTVTEGLAMTVDDLSLANVFEFYAIDIRPMERLTRLNDPLAMVSAQRPSQNSTPSQPNTGETEGGAQ